MIKVFGRICIDLGLLLIGFVKLWLPLVLILCGILFLKLYDNFYIDID